MSPLQIKVNLHSRLRCTFCGIIGSKSADNVLTLHAPVALVGICYGPASPLRSHLERDLEDWAGRAEHSAMHREPRVAAYHLTN